MKLTTEFTNLEKSAVKLTVTIAKKDVQESYNSIVAKYVKSPAADIKLGLPYIDKNGKLLASDIDTQIKWYTANKLISGKLEAKDVAITSFQEAATK